MSPLLTVALTFAFATVSFAASCEKPEVTSHYFTTVDATVLTHIAYITQFSIRCSNGRNDTRPLYVEIDGAVVPVPTVGHGIYQVSWSKDIKVADSGSKIVKVYSEDSSSALRKALRDGDKEPSVPALYEIPIYHPGAYNGPWFKSEFLAVVASLVVAYIAINTKSRLES